MPTLARETLKINDRVLVYKYKLLGNGSKGAVYKGRYGKDIVAVKEIFKHSDGDEDEDLETKQYMLLQRERHSNVVGHRCVQDTAHFRYIVLELCQGSLDDTGTILDLTREIGAKELLRQIADGVGHLHSLGILHGSLKPSNILISFPDTNGKRRAVISDFGSSRSERRTMTQDVGTSPEKSIWKTPEVWGPNSQRLVGPTTDIFSMGCIFYFILTCGGHPFGDDENQADKTRDLSLSSLVGWGNDNNHEDLDEECYASLGGTAERKEKWNWCGYEAEDLIARMIDNEPSKRPRADGVVNHPFFWQSKKRIDFLRLASDRLRQKRDEPESAKLLALLESGASGIVGDSWLAKLDTNDFSQAFHKPPEGQKDYDHTQLEQLLRAIRNTTHQLDQLDSAAQICIGKSSSELLFYITDKFPRLLMHVYCVIDKFRGGIPEELDFRHFYISTFEGFEGAYGRNFGSSIADAVSIKSRGRKKKPKTFGNAAWAMEFALYVLSASLLAVGWLGDGRRFATFMVLSASAAIYGVMIGLLKKGV